MSQLKGVKVLELASVLAGPSVGQFFAEVGAEVIKVENLKTGGDVTRSWKTAGEQTDDRSAYFCSVNWGKQSIAVDLTKPKGKEIVASLASRSDIIIASYKPGDAEKLGVSYEVLSKNNPGLIYGQTTGYGSNNPRVGYDAIIQAEAGFMFMNGEPGRPSMKMPVALMDILAGHHLKEGLLLAMLEKTQTGRGKLVEVSLIQAAISSLANQASNWLVANKLPKKQGSAHPNIAPYGDVFITRDGKEILFAVGSDRQFEDLCSILNITSKIEKFSTNQLRVENRTSLYDILSKSIKDIDASDLMEKAHQSKIPAGIIQNIEQTLAMPEASELMIKSDDLKGIRSFVAHSPASDIKSSHFYPPPHLGEHSRFILTEKLNFSVKNVEELIKNKIIG